MFESPTGLGIRDDAAGGSYFGDPRGPNRPLGHQGLDKSSVPGQDILMPFTGRLSVSGSGGVWATTSTGTGARVDVFYVYTTNTTGNRRSVQRGSSVGTANNMTVEYNDPRMTNHVHVRVDVNGRTVNPAPFFIRNR